MGSDSRGARAAARSCKQESAPDKAKRKAGRGAEAMDELDLAAAVGAGWDMDDMEHDDDHLEEDYDGT